MRLDEDIPHHIVHGGLDHRNLKMLVPGFRRFPCLFDDAGFIHRARRAVSFGGTFEAKGDARVTFPVSLKQ
jgi:hypothetical protein